MKRDPVYRTTKDIVIPAGTIIASPPTRSTRWGKDHEGVVGLGKDHVGYFTVDTQEGLISGFLEEA